MREVSYVYQVYFFHGVPASTVLEIGRTNRHQPARRVLSLSQKKNRLKKTVHTSLTERRNVSEAASFHSLRQPEGDHAIETSPLTEGYVIPFAVDLRTDCDVTPFLKLHPDLTGRIYCSPGMAYGNQTPRPGYPCLRTRSRRC